jgi:cytochrome c553
MRYQTKYSVLAVALLCMSTTLVNAQDELPVPADEFVYCETCHGVQLMGNPILKAPRLSGMDAWYIEQQMQSFKNGWRGTHEGDLIGMEMQPMAAALSDEQISESAEYVSMTRSELPPITVSGDAAKGRAIYRNCGACHGQSADGVEALGGPELTASNDWYLVTQLRKFKDGSLGNQPEDTYGKQMRAGAQVLTDDESIMDVVSYISTLREE